MNIDKFKSLENVIEGKNYEKANFTKNLGWFLISWFFQILNIGISFFGLHTLLTSFFETNNTIFSVALIILPILILFAIEFLKRDTIKSTIYILKNKAYKKMYGTAVLLLCLIGFSAFFAIDGAKEISSKQKNIEKEMVANIDTVTSKIDSTYETRINYKLSQIQKREERIDKIYESAKYWDGRSRSLNRNETENIDKLSKQIEVIKLEIDKLKEEKNKEIKFLEQKIKNKGESELNENESKSLVFLIIVFVIETFIVIGVSYTAVFNYMTYKEKKGDDMYQKLILYIKLLRIIYQDGKITKNTKLIGIKKLSLLFKDNNEDMSETDTKKYMDVLEYLNIIKTQGNRKVLKVDFEEAKTILQDYISNNY